MIFILAFGEREKWRRAKIYSKRLCKGVGKLRKSVSRIRIRPDPDDRYNRPPPRSRPRGGTRTDTKMSSEQKLFSKKKCKDERKGSHNRAQDFLNFFIYRSTYAPLAINLR